MRSAARGFPAGARLRRPSEFDRVYRTRSSAADGPLVVHACPSAIAGPPRIGLSVSRRVGNAVVRNRWKRRLREAFRTVRGLMPAGQDYVVVVRPGPVPTGKEGAERVGAMLVGLAIRIVSRPGYGVAKPAVATPRPRRR